MVIQVHLCPAPKPLMGSLFRARTVPTGWGGVSLNPGGMTSEGPTF